MFMAQMAFPMYNLRSVGSLRVTRASHWSAQALHARRIPPFARGKCVPCRHACLCACRTLRIVRVAGSAAPALGLLRLRLIGLFSF